MKIKLLTNYIHVKQWVSSLCLFLSGHKKSILIPLLLTFMQSGFGQTTVNYNMSSLGLDNAEVTGTSSYTVVSGIITVAFAQNSSGTAPTYYTSGGVRLYQNATKGGSMRISVASGYKITGITVTKATGDGDGPAGYLVDGGTEAGTFVDGTTSNVIPTSGTLNATSYVEYYNKGGSSSQRCYITAISVTYAANGPSITLGNSNVLSGALTATYGTASATTRTVTVSGSGLSANITATAASSNFEVSSNGTTWGSTATFTRSGTSASGTLYVRLSATAPVNGSYNNADAATLSSTSATNVIAKTTTTGNSVSKKALTVTAGNQSVTYGTAASTVTGAGTYSLSGFANGESATTVSQLTGGSGTPTYTTTYTATTNAGATGITITPVITSLSATNYSFSAANGTITINRANTTSVTVINGSPYTYIPGTPQGPGTVTVVPSASNGSVSYSYSGTENGGATYGPSSTKPTNAGSYSVIATVAQNTNYNSASSSPLAFTINKAGSEVTVTGDASFAFNGNPHGPTTYDKTGSTGSVTFEYTGIDGTVYATSSTRPTAVGKYKAVATLAADNNYNGAVSDDFNFQITSVPVPQITSSLTWSMTYGVAAINYTITASNNPTSFGVSGLPSGLNYNSATHQITGTPSDAPGDYDVSLTATNEGGTSDPDILVITIAKKDVTISNPVVSDKIYDGNNTATLSGVINGLIAGDNDVTLNLIAHFDDVNGNVGNDKPVTSSSTLTGNKAEYYNLIQPTGLKANITKATPTVTVTGTTSFVYNGAGQGPDSSTVTPSGAGTATYSYSGTDNGGATYGPTATKPTNAGSYSVIASLAESANYIAVSSSGYAFTITKANQALTGFGSNITKLSTDVPFNLPAAITTTGGQTVVYTITNSPNTGVATVSGNTVTITGVGTTGITAHADATTNYNVFDANINLTVNWNSAVVPTATAATNILSSSFTANWGSVIGATSYKLDVYKKTTTNNQVEVINATFSDLAGTGGNDGTWTGNVGTNGLTTYTNAGWAFTSSGGASGCIKSGSGSSIGSVTTPALSALSGNAVLTFRAGGFGTDGTVLTVSITGGGSISGTNSFTLTNSAFSSYTVNIVGGTASSKLNFASATGGKRFFIDDIKVVSTSVVNTTTLVTGAPFTILAQDPQPASYSYLVTGLDRDTQYYYVVRAVNGATSSGNSNEIAVKTANTVTWNGTSWNNSGVGPDGTLDAEISGSYTLATNFEAKNLTITQDGSLQIQANHGITINGDIIAPDDKIIIESDGSLTQTKLTNGNSAVKIIAKRNVSMKTADYTYWSSPVDNQVLLNTLNPNATNSTGGFSPGSPNNRTYEYNESNDTFKATADQQFAAAKGYAIRGKSTYGSNFSADVLSFKGNLHNGDYFIQIQKSKNTLVSGISTEHGYNMIGNPYPSNIDFDKFYNLDNGSVKNSASILGKAWFWTNVPGAPASQGGSAYVSNNYATYSQAGGVPATGSDAVDSSIPTKFIKVAQGFIVQMRTAAPTGTTPDFRTLKFDNSIRSNDSSGHFYNNKTSESEINRYWLKLVSPYNVVNTILLAHIDGATNNYDADYDSELLTLGDDSFYSKLNTQKLQIQARNNPLDNNDAIQLGTKYSVNGTYKIKLGNKEGVFKTNQKIYLIDKLMNTYTDITSQDYSFTATKGIDENRFEIVYKDKQVLGTDSVTKSDFTVYKDGTYYVINSSKALGKIEVYDTAGRLVISQKTKDKTIRLDAATLSNGIYIIKAENSGDVRTKKIIR